MARCRCPWCLITPPDRSLTPAQDPGREPVSPPPGPAENGRRWDTLGPGHDRQACPICAGEPGEFLPMALAVAALSFLLFGLLFGWWS